MKKLLAAMAVLGAILYPLVVYFGLSRFQPRYLAIFLGVVLLLKLAGGRMLGPSSTATVEQTGRNNPERYLNILLAVLLTGLVLYTFANNEPGSLKLYPVVISFVLLLSFAWSVLYPPTAIERIARITDPDLPVAGVKYTRTITLVWCGFFLCNGLVALYTTLYASFEVWALYNGLIAYVLIACLLGGELLYRHRFLKKG
ncbi:MAG: hypothetical protein V4628_12570 [Pseudomonadota bacterium]